MMHHSIGPRDDGRVEIDMAAGFQDAEALIDQVLRIRHVLNHIEKCDDIETVGRNGAIVVILIDRRGDVRDF